MALPHPLPDDLVELIARRFRVLGEPMRIRLLDRLREGEASVGELREALDASQQNVSKHLAVLAEVGILGRRKQGNHVYYRIVDEGVFALCEQVCGSVQQQLRALSELVAGESDAVSRPSSAASMPLPQPLPAASSTRRRSGRSAGLAAGPPTTSASSRSPGPSSRSRSASSHRRSRPRSPAPAGRRTARSRCRRAS